MRRAVAVAALSLFVVLNVSAAEQQRRELPREKGSPIAKIVRTIVKTIQSLGDAPVNPRP